MRIGREPRPASTGRERRAQTLGARIALSYSVFLLLCLILGVVLYASSTRSARESFWRQHMARFNSCVQTMDGYLDVMDNYTRRLLTDSTFVRFANMRSTQEQGFFTTAYDVMQSLSSQLYGLSNLPVEESHIYLENVGYVISGSQFTEAEQYYRSYRHFTPGGFDAFIDALLASDGVGRNIDVTPFSGIDGDRFFVRNIDQILNRSVPAVIWFEWDEKKIADLFLTGDVAQGCALLVADGKGDAQMLLTGGGDAPDAALCAQLPALAFDAQGFARLQGLRVMRRASLENGWTYLLAVPEAICAQALGSYDVLFAIMVVLAALGGAVLVASMVRTHMRPIHRLSDQLQEAERDNELLAHDLERQKPMVCASYTRKLLSGHISSSDEFAYIMRFLGLEGELRFYVLYFVAYDQQSNALTRTESYECIASAIPAYLETDYPCYFYTTVDGNCVALVAYGEQTEDPLMDLQHRTLGLHDFMLTEYGLWLYAGVGRICLQPSKLWEAYEQARTAARYTAKHHVFLPYEMMKKDSQNAYYPIEISAKLLHFITSGNKAQVLEMFALIHQENVIERTLAENMFSFLLSDIRNTLLKARFSISNPTPEQEAQLRALDERLGGTATFALCENIAVELSGFFRQTEAAGDPIPEVKAYLRENFTDPSMCLSKLSDRFHISESYLSHLFKEKTGQNFFSYLEELRLTEAARRLQQEKHCPLQTLYVELGYNNAATFRRAFKKRFGIPPSEMREARRERGD